MRLASRLAFALLLVAAACGKKGGDAEGGAGASGASVVASENAGPPRHATDDALRTLPVPVLAAGSRADNIPDGPLVAVSGKAIVVEGRAMVVVDGGKVEPAALQADGKAMRIGPIVRWADSWTKTPAAAASEAVLVAIDPTLPSGLALQVLQSFIPSQQRRFAFVVRTPDGPGTVPLALPTPATAPTPATPPTPATNPDDMPVQLVVTVATDRVLLWSISKLEGTLTSPKLQLTPASDGAWLAQLRDALVDVRNRRWGGRHRPEDQKTIVVMVDAGVASGDLVNVVAAVRADTKGDPLFPDVQLSLGFDDAAAIAAATQEEDAAKATAAAEAERLQRESAAVAAALSEQEVARFADLLTGEGSSDIDHGDMSARRPGADLNAQLSDVAAGGKQVSIGGGAARGTRGDGDPRVGMGMGPKIDGPGAGSGSGGVEKTPPGRITVAGKTAIDDTSLTVDAVLAKMLSAYMPGLKRCYKEQLKKDPTMRGSVTLSITVNETGRATNAQSMGMSSELDACFEGMMAAWRFAVPKDSDGEAVEASFKIKLGLVPD